MKKIELDEQKKIELDILKYIKKVCMENNITYFLGYGTLLGAVRHKGFIPWDDDIDILMPRKDYNKFIEVMEKKDDSKYKIFTPKQKDYYLTLSKVVDTRTTLKELDVNPISNLGVFVDIFPLDGLPIEEEKLKEHVQSLFKLDEQIRLYLKFAYKGARIWYNKVLKFILAIPMFIATLIFPWKKYQLQILEKMEKYDYDKSSKVGFIITQCKEKEILDKKIFEKAVMLPFEDDEFPAPIGYIEYLECLYGDYMTPPPLVDRVSPHNAEVHWKDETLK